MKKESSFKYPKADTALNALVVAGMAVSCAVLVALQAVQTVVA